MLVRGYGLQLAEIVKEGTADVLRIVPENGGEILLALTKLELRRLGLAVKLAQE
jgi:hypothetical protein